MGTRTHFFDTVAELKRNGQAFAIATVVARRAPVSAHLGDRAIVYADGRMEGFVGGACSREIIRKQGLDALRARQARLVSIRPDAAAAGSTDPEHIIVTMTCASEGAVDVYVEPILPARRLVVVGATPVADALARLGQGMDYDVVRVVDAAEVSDLSAEAHETGAAVVPLEALPAAISHSADVAAVVASQGHYDEQALEAILASGTTAVYVGLVASRKRGASVLAVMRENGAPGLDRVRCPAGIDLGARTATEVALSILAELVQQRSRDAASPADGLAAAIGAAGPSTGPARVAVDPVCGMDVVVATAKHRAELEGTTYYFCCPHCRAHFLKDPHTYLAARS